MGDAGLGAGDELPVGSVNHFVAAMDELAAGAQRKVGRLQLADGGDIETVCHGLAASATDGEERERALMLLFVCFDNPGCSLPIATEPK